MSTLEDIQPNASCRGILPDALVTVVNVQWFGSEALELTYKDAAGKLGSEFLYRHDEPRIEIVEKGRPWNVHYAPYLDYRPLAEGVNYHFAELLARAEAPR